MLGKHQAAIADYTQAIALDLQDALAYNNRGLSHQALRDRKAALADYQKAADLYQQQGKTSGYQDALNRMKGSIWRFLFGNS